MKPKNMLIKKSSKKVNTIIFVFVLLFTIIALQKVSFAQSDSKSNEDKQRNQEEIIRVNTSLVTIPAIVLDRDGQYMPKLKKENFQIFENGVEQRVEFFEPTDAPFTILFLIDASSSMSPHKENLSAALNALFTRLRPNDQIMAESFFQWTKNLLDPTKIANLNEGIKFKMSSEGDCPDTYLYNAVDNALNRMRKTGGRKAIIVLTDGNGGGFGISAKDTLRKAEEQEAIIYTFKFENTVSDADLPMYVNKKQYHKVIEERRSYLHNLAQISGGRGYLTENIKDVEETFGSLIKELGRQYRIGYYPKQSGKEGETRQVKVKVNIPDAAVRARSNYVVKNSK